MMIHSTQIRLKKTKPKTYGGKKNRRKRKFDKYDAWIKQSDHVIKYEL